MYRESSDEYGGICEEIENIFPGRDFPGYESEPSTVLVCLLYLDCSPSWSACLAGFSYEPCTNNRVHKITPTLSGPLPLSVLLRVIIHSTPTCFLSIFSSSSMAYRSHTASPAGSQSPASSSSSPYINSTPLDTMVPTLDDQDSSYSAHGTPNHSTTSLPRTNNAGKGGCW